MAKEQKLLRKDVLKLIDGLTSGQYTKGTGQLVTIEENGDSNFCCLGVWADQHGCVWHEINPAMGIYVPSLSNSRKDPIQMNGTGTLKGKLAFGLTKDQQGKLASLNDGSESWREVLHCLVDEILPKAV